MQSKRNRTPRDRSRRLVCPARRGFTLMEMMVVIGLVALMATMALPSIMALFNAGADAQAYNLISAQLTAARALAIEKSIYAGVHVQLAARELTDRDDADEGPRLRTEACYSGIILYRPSKEKFWLHGEPRRTPGSIAYGKVAVSGSGSTVNNAGRYTGDASDLRKFTTFTVVFSPQGSAIRRLPGKSGGLLVEFDEDDPAFKTKQILDTRDIAGSRQIWDFRDVTGGEEAVTALCVFDMGEYMVADQVGSATKYLDESASVIPLNIHTGQLYPRE